MATTERRLAEADRRARRLLAAVGDEIRNARLGIGISQATLGRAAAMSRTKVGRIEQGRPETSVCDLTRLSGLVGLDLSVRAYPGGQPLRDGAHGRLIDALRRRLGRPLRLRTEVPLPVSGDPRAWDGVIVGGTMPVGLEAEMRLRDAQAVDRKIALKQRDGGIDVVILLIADTHANRRALAAVGPALGERFPLRTRAVLEALGDGVVPPASGIVLLRPLPDAATGR
jgi:transcriptional regulator with XRE-family HTH domain